MWKQNGECNNTKTYKNRLDDEMWKQNGECNNTKAT